MLPNPGLGFGLEYVLARHCTRYSGMPRGLRSSGRASHGVPVFVYVWNDLFLFGEVLFWSLVTLATLRRKIGESGETKLMKRGLLLDKRLLLGASAAFAHKLIVDHVFNERTGVHVDAALVEPFGAVYALQVHFVEAARF